MGYKLKDNPSVRYNYSDKRMFSLLSLEPKTTTDLAKEFYRGSDRRFPRISARQILMNLMERIEINKEPFRIISSGRSGPNPMDWQLVPRVFTKTTRNELMRIRLKAVKSKVEAA
jgi:hypothetical protein